MRSSQKSADKLVRHRERLRAAGLRPVQFWVPDTRSPEFAAQLREQCKGLNGTPSEGDVLRFAEGAASEIEGWK